MIIYKVTNLINGKLYVGQTVQPLEKRWATHLNKGHALFNAISKYGRENFKIEAIDSAESIQELNLKEIQWIQELRTLAPIGYNLRAGGEGGGSLSQITKERVGKAVRGRKHTEEWKKDMSLRNSGENNPMFGKQISEESAAKRKKKMEKYYSDPEYLRSMSEKKKASLLADPLSSKKLGSYTKKYWANPENRKKQSIDHSKPFICEQTGEFFQKAKDAAIKFGTSVSSINRILLGTKKSINGFTFKRI